MKFKKVSLIVLLFLVSISILVCSSDRAPANDNETVESPVATEESPSVPETSEKTKSSEASKVNQSTDRKSADATENLETIIEMIKTGNVDAEKALSLIHLFDGGRTSCRFFIAYFCQAIIFY